MGNQCCVASNEAGALDFTTPYGYNEESAAARLRRERLGESNIKETNITPDEQDTKLTLGRETTINDRNLHPVKEITTNIKRGEIGEKGNNDVLKEETNLEETGGQPKKVRAGTVRKRGDEEPEEERNPEFSDPQNYKLVITEAKKEFKVKPKANNIGSYYYGGEDNNLRKSQGALRNEGILLKSSIIKDGENHLQKSKVPKIEKSGELRKTKIHQLSDDFNPADVKDLKNSTNVGIGGRRGIGISS